jgi:hypothetical protein
VTSAQLAIQAADVSSCQTKILKTNTSSTKAVLVVKFTTFSFPVGYSERRSFFERTATSSHSLRMIVKNRFGIVVFLKFAFSFSATATIAGFHVYIKCKKPRSRFSLNKVVKMELSSWNFDDGLADERVYPLNDQRTEIDFGERSDCGERSFECCSD